MEKSFVKWATEVNSILPIFNELCEPLKIYPYNSLEENNKKPRKSKLTSRKTLVLPICGNLKPTDMEDKVFSRWRTLLDWFFICILLGSINITSEVWIYDNFFSIHSLYTLHQYSIWFRIWNQYGVFVARKQTNKTKHMNLMSLFTEQNVVTRSSSTRIHICVYV